MPTNTSDLNDSINISPNNSQFEKFDEELNAQRDDGAQSVAQISLNQSNSVDEIAIDFEPPTKSTIANVADSPTSSEVIGQTIKPEPVFQPLLEANAQAVEDVFLL